MLIIEEGRLFGRGVITSEVNRKHPKRRRFSLLCSCGIEYEVDLCNLTKPSSPVQSCGCYQTEMAMKKNSVDLSGQRFGMLLVDSLSERVNGTVRWDCICDCGGTCSRTSESLRSKFISSCGCNIRGSNSIHWNPELTLGEREIQRNTPENKEWSLLIKKKDNFTCQKCLDNTGGNLVSHHILSYSKYKEARYDIDNGITLCEECHKEFHHLYGYMKFTDSDLWEWIKDE